jgi:Bacterial PH domain
VIKYKDIKEVTLRKGILQRGYGLGTIYLATLATGSTSSFNPFYALGFGNVSASGVGVRDILNPDEAYEKIKGLVETHNV